MILKVLRESGFDFSKLPPDVNEAVSLLDRSTAGTFESDNQKLNVLDETIFRSIKNLYPADEAVRITDELVREVDSEIVNDGFNTVLREEYYQTKPEIDENFNRPISVVYTPVAPERLNEGDGLVSLLAKDGKQVEFYGKANNKEIQIITETFGQEWIPIFEKFLDDIIDLYPYEQWNRDSNGFKYKTIGASKRKDGYFYLIGEDNKIYLVHNFSLFPTEKPDVLKALEKPKGFSYLISSGKAKNYSEPGVREITHGIRQGDEDAIKKAAEFLSSQISSDDILIPIPNRTGGHSYANSLSKEIAKQTGATVFEGLHGAVRPSVYETKMRGKDPKEVDFGFYIEGQIPKKGRIYRKYFIVDNVIGTGTTMLSAQTALQREGVYADPLVYSVDDRFAANGSEVDEVWYHGTDGSFEAFDISKAKGGSSMFGLWFTDDSELAKMFGENVYKAKLSFKNPKTISFDKWDDIRERHAKDEDFFKNWRKELIDEGYDSLYIKERISDFAGQKVRDPNTVVVFSQDNVEIMNEVHAADGKTIDKEIIGHVTTKPMTWIAKTSEGESQKQEVPSETYAVISTFEQNNHTFYVTNKWYDEAKRKPLIIVDDIAERYEPIKVKLLKKTTLKDFQSGSSLDCYENQIFVIGDDARHVLCVDTDFNEIRRFRIFDEGTSRIAKDVKSDLETSTIVDIGGIPHILILGSGTRENRAVGFLLNTDLDIITDKFRYNNFVSRLKENGIIDVNIEGSTIVDGKFLLVNRGNKTNPDNFLIVTDNLFWENQNSASIFLSRIQLPDKDAGVSEITYDKETDTLFFTASIEDTTNAIDDGRIGDSFIGYISNISQKLTNDTIQADEFINLTKISPEFTGQKIEGLCVERKTDHYHILDLVSDNDNDESHLFKIRMRLPGCDFDHKTGKCNNGCKTEVEFAKGGLLAPNGKPTNLTPKQYSLVRTPAFKKWFGDWENSPETASKVVDENGEPLIVWHSSRKDNDFNVFKKDYSVMLKLKDEFGKQYTKNDIGFYFSENKNYANKKFGGNARQFFLNIRNITDVRSIENNTIAYYRQNWKEYDGFFGRDYGSKQIVYVVFEPTQIKLADGSNTKFDGNNPDIRYDNGGGVNSLTDIVEDYRKKLDKAPPAYYGFRGYVDRNLTADEVKIELERFKLDEYDPKYPIADVPDHPNHSACRGVSYGLAKALNEAGFKARVIAGWYLNAGWGYHAEHSALSSWPPSFLQGFNAKEHWWVEADGLYIDITADQFHPYEPKKQEANRILIGKKEDMIMKSHYPIKREFIGTAGEMTTDLNALAAKMTEKLAKKQLDRYSIDKIKNWVDKNAKKLSPQQLIDLKAQLYNEAYSSEKHSYPEIVKEITYGGGGNIPYVVYHGTDKEYEYFDKKHLGSSYGATPSNMLGFFFTNDKKVAGTYGKNVRAYRITMNKPYIVDAKGQDYSKFKHELNEIAEKIKCGKYDGIIIKNYGDAGIYSNDTIISDNYIVFDTSQIEPVGPIFRASNGGLIAPNGKPSNLTPEQYRLVRTPAFKTWFGDWENSPETASRVVDENGEPMVVWHGSNREFNVFDIKTVKYVGSNGDGFYFSPDIYESKKYGNNVRGFFVRISNPISPGQETLTENHYRKLIDAINDDEEYKEDLKNYGFFEDKDYVSFRNKLAKDLASKDDYYALFDLTNTTTGSIRYISKALKSMDIIRDGVISPVFREYVAFHPEQIKLADGNTTFDGNNPDIRFDNGGNIPPVDEGGKTGTTDIELVNEAEVIEAKVEGNIKPAKLTPEEVRVKLTELRESEPDPQLTMLSFGGGQDSFSMLYSYIHDPEFRRKYAPNDFLVVMSDTGNEHPHTYKAVKEAEQICKKHNIHFKLITPDMGYHTPSWPDLKTNLKKNSSILSATMQSKPCTPNLKINVVDKYMYHYMCELYGFDELDNKKSWEFYRDKFKTKARVLIGFAKDEEMRAVNSLRNHQFLPVWKKATMQYVYPLLEEGWNRESAQEIIKKYHPYVMPPSNCMLCFYQSDQELLWLEHHYPEELNEWIDMERAKQQKTIEDMPKVREMMEAETDLEKKEKLIKKLKSMEKNYGVYGTLTLPEKLKKAKEKYGHWTIEQLNEYKMSHGHCVKSSF